MNGVAGGVYVVKNLLWIYGDLKESLADENRFYCVGRSCRKEFYIRKRKINKKSGRKGRIFEGIRHGAREKEKRPDGYVFGRCFVDGQEHDGSVCIGAIFR